MSAPPTAAGLALDPADVAPRRDPQPPIDGLTIRRGDPLLLLRGLRSLPVALA